jgi:aconitase A
MRSKIVSIKFLFSMVIHKTNLKKQGMLALTFADKADHDQF